MKSLQDQLLQAGLVNDKKAKQVNKEKRKQAKTNRRTGKNIENETTQAAKQRLAEKAQHDKAMNLKRQQKADEKAIQAQIKQLITSNKIDRDKGEITYNFTTDNKIKKIRVTALLQDQLSNGRLAIAKLEQGKEVTYEIIPSVVAAKIAQRNENYIVLLNDKTSDTIDEDDPYADYQIPDDLMW